MTEPESPEEFVTAMYNDIDPSLCVEGNIERLAPYVRSRDRAVALRVLEELEQMYFEHPMNLQDALKRLRENHGG